jgi:SAM-dependent methyltransferase
MRAESYVEMDRVEGHHWWFVARRAILKKVLSNCQLPANASILEIGCGTGGNLSMLTAYGNVDAVEMDQNAIQFAKAKIDGAVDIRKGKCPDEIPFAGKKYDLICLFDVLEHIEEETETLFALKKRLKPEGIILVTVPAYQWLWSSHDENLHHKRRYTVDKLRSVATEAQLAAKTSTYFNTLLFPLAAIARIAERFSKKEMDSEAPPAPAINSLFRWVFQLERFLIEKIPLPFGVSILVKLQHQDSNAE